MHVCMYICIHTCTYRETHVYLYIQMCISMSLCVSVCVVLFAYSADQFPCNMSFDSCFTDVIGLSFNVHCFYSGSAVLRKVEIFQVVLLELSPACFALGSVPSRSPQSCSFLDTCAERGNCVAHCCPGVTLEEVAFFQVVFVDVGQKGIHAGNVGVRKENGMLDEHR